MSRMLEKQRNKMINKLKIFFWKMGYDSDKCPLCKEILLPHGFKDSEDGRYFTCEKNGCKFK
jgi:hypothetical protein